jgi:uncharacterized membrane protein
VPLTYAGCISRGALTSRRTSTLEPLLQSILRAAPVSFAGSRRDAAVDRLRGLAVVLMLLANLAPYLAPAPHPVAYRAVSTFCAPAFVLLAGSMAARHAGSPSAAVKRGLGLIAIGALLDVAAWGIGPFRSFDVLYLIGAALPVAALAARLPVGAILGAAAAVFVVTDLARAALVGRSEGADLPEVPYLALLGGWFPLLPWLAVALLGAASARKALGTRASAAKSPASWGAVLMAAGAVAWGLGDPMLVSRGGYAEYFYPPSFGVLALFSGAALLTLAAMRRWPALPLAWLEPFGRRSLAVYVVHVVLIARVIAPLQVDPGWPQLAIGFLCLVVASAVAVSALDALRPPLVRA